jgi:GNAT superfamily N-acetyltransferase
MLVNIRRACLDDMSVLVRMCAEHASYERTVYEADGKATLLVSAIFSFTPRLFVWVAHLGDEVIAYASATIDFSTWNARDFVYLDCLFVREGFRSHGIGRILLNAVVDFAQELNAANIQWQTPDWNIEAANFYRRSGAIEVAKRRFTLKVRPQN